MKKLLTVILAIAMITSIASVAAFAEEKELNKVNIRAIDVAVKEGTKTVDVEIVAEYAGNDGLASFTFAVEAMNGASVTKLVAGDAITGNKMVHENVIVGFAEMDSTGSFTSIPSGTVLAVATISLPEGTKIGDEFTVVIDPSDDSGNFSDATPDFKPQEGVGVNGKITVVKGFTPGDVDDNGKVNAKDIIAIMRHMLGNTPEVFISDAADMDGNGKINAKDIISIMRLMLSK